MVWFPDTAGKQNTNKWVRGIKLVHAPICFSDIIMAMSSLNINPSLVNKHTCH